MKKTVSLLLLILATSLFAQEAPQAEIIYPASDEIPAGKETILLPDGAAPVGGGAATGVFYVIFLAAIGTIVWYFWRQRSPSGAGACPKSLKGIEIGSTRSLGNRQFLVVARYKDKEILLGVGPGFIHKVESFESEQKEDACSKEPSA